MNQYNVFEWRHMSTCGLLSHCIWWKRVLCNTLAIGILLCLLVWYKADDPDAAITSQSTNETRFYFQDFEYADHPDAMYVHCNATFCHINDYSRACEPQCSHRKRKGNSNNIGPTGYNDSGPIGHEKLRTK
jgi:hypothetical protein